MTSQTTLITFETVPIHRPMCQMFLVIVYSSSFAPRTQAFCFEGDSLTTCRINPAFDMHITRGRRRLWKNRVSERKSERQHDSKGMYSLFDHKDVYHTGQSKPQRRCVHPTRMGNGRSPGSRLDGQHIVLSITSCLELLFSLSCSLKYFSCIGNLTFKMTLGKSVVANIEK